MKAMVSISHFAIMVATKDGALRRKNTKKPSQPLRSGADSACSSQAGAPGSAQALKQPSHADHQVVHAAAHVRTSEVHHQQDEGRACSALHAILPDHAHRSATAMHAWLARTASSSCNSSAVQYPTTPPVGDRHDLSGADDR